MIDRERTEQYLSVDRVVVERVIGAIDPRTYQLVDLGLLVSDGTLRSAHQQNISFSSSSFLFNEGVNRKCLYFLILYFFSSQCQKSALNAVPL